MEVVEEYAWTKETFGGSKTILTRSDLLAQQTFSKIDYINCFHSSWHTMALSKVKLFEIMYKIMRIPAMHFCSNLNLH